MEGGLDDDEDDDGESWRMDACEGVLMALAGYEIDEDRMDESEDGDGKAFAWISLALSPQIARSQRDSSLTCLSNVETVAVLSLLRSVLKLQRVFKSCTDKGMVGIASDVLELLDKFRMELEKNVLKMGTLMQFGELTVRRRVSYILEELVTVCGFEARLMVLDMLQPLVQQLLGDPRLGQWFETITSPTYCEFWNESNYRVEEADLIWLCSGDDIPSGRAGDVVARVKGRRDTALTWVDRELLRSWIGISVDIMIQSICEEQSVIMKVVVERVDRLVAGHVVSNNLCQLMYDLYSDNDKSLIKLMLNSLNIHSKNAILPRTAALRPILTLCNPTRLFFLFLHKTAFDPDVLLDLLIGPETPFLEFVVMFLRWLAENDDARSTLPDAAAFIASLDAEGDEEETAISGTRLFSSVFNL
ncbi:hypothetical protein HDU97_005019 [Phlyctochytrium planicorne]|nr:hypothetical protein HDU97_005019 [Phlyctochytrium planicorne]